MSNTGGSTSGTTAPNPNTSSLTATAVLPSSSGSIRIPPLRGSENWRIWRVRMEDLLGELELIEYVDGTKAQPSSGASGLDDWLKSDRKARGIIRRCVDDNVMTNILACETSSEVWTQLKQLYEVADIVAIIELRRNFFSHRMLDETRIDDHVRTMRSWYDQLRAIDSNLANDFDWAIALIASLPLSWDVFIQTLRPLLNFQDKTKWPDMAKQVTSSVMAEGQRKEQRSVEAGLLAKKNTAAAATFGSGGSNGKNTGGGQGKRKGECNYCHKKGHWERECRKKKADQEKKKETAHIASTGEQGDQDQTDQGGAVAFVAKAPTSFSSHEWIADSGAGSHIVGNRTYFSTYEPVSEVVEGIGGDVPIVGRGTVRAIIRNGNKSNELLLRNVAHVPSFAGNLLSCKVIDLAGGACLFKGGRCTVYAPDGRTLGVGPKIGDSAKGSLYLMNISVITPTTQVAVARGDMDGSKSWEDWHRIMGHINQGALERLFNKNMVNGMKVDRDSPRNYFCEACVQAKHHIASYPQESKSKYNSVGDLTVTDVWGPARTQSLQGNSYFVTFTDMYSRFTIASFMKSTKEVFEHYKAYEALLANQFGKQLKRVRSDNGKEFVNKTFKDYAASQGTILEETAPHSSAQNGVAERKNRTLVEGARAQLFAQQLPRFLWQEAVSYMVYIANRSPTHTLGDITPYERFYGRKPHIGNLQEFGAECWVLDQSGSNGKLDVKSKKYRFTGFADNSTAWRYYKQESRQILKSRNIIFPPRPKPGGVDWTELELYQLAPAVSPAEGESGASQLNSALLQQPKPTPAPGVFTPPSKATALPPTAPKPEEKKPTLGPLMIPKSISNPTSRIPTPVGSPTYRVGRGLGPSRPVRSSSATRPNYVDLDSVGKPTVDNDTSYPKYGKPVGVAHIGSEEDVSLEREWREYVYAAISRREDDDHPSYEQTLSRWDADKWSIARDEEIAAFERMGTFELVELPDGFKPLKPGWVNTIKRNADLEITRYRARLVVKGYGQRFGVDFNEVVAHVLRADSWRILIALAAIHDWDIHQLDVISAFLNGRVEEEIYMVQIPGYEDGTNRVLRIHGSLYGLKQAPRIWMLTFGKAVKTIGFEPIASEPSCFIRRTDNGDLCILAVYVDDIALFATKGYASKVKKELMALFEMRDMGELGHFLGYRVTRDRAKRTINISQDAYIKNLIDRAGLADANPTTIPLPAGTQLERYTGPPVDFPYARHIGGILYATLATRPDAAYANQHLSQFNSNPGPKHIAGLKSLFRYLRGTLDYGLTYTGLETSAQPVGYSDADWAQNILDRKSISGVIFTLAGAAICWISKKQPTVALSSMEGEYMALSLAVRHGLWIKMFFEELGFPLESTLSIYTDNTAAIALAHDPQFHARSKHIDTRHHFLREHVTRKTIELSHIPGNENLADLFTKALPRPRFNYLASKVMGRRT
ncbi:Retrovirus-related Pol polyprotein from transposon TNT 1-94 [Ceratobasidium sp. AG-Ba]|nr:Retrovirus-related Pol polyprotein from transposon TNT 1-94 [Ceratobasidium sp. AG-Ba]